MNDDFNWSKVPSTAHFEVFYDTKSWVFHNGTAVGPAESFNLSAYMATRNMSYNASENLTGLVTVVLRRTHELDLVLGALRWLCLGLRSPCGKVIKA